MKEKTSEQTISDMYEIYKEISRSIGNGKYDLILFGTTISYYPYLGELNKTPTTHNKQATVVSRVLNNIKDDMGVEVNTEELKRVIMDIEMGPNGSLNDADFNMAIEEGLKSIYAKRGSLLGVL